MVPDVTEEFVRDDLVGLGAAVDEFRAGWGWHERLLPAGLPAQGRQPGQRRGPGNGRASSSSTPGERRIGAVVVGRGRKAQLVDWVHLSGFGPDAVMVHDEGPCARRMTTGARRAPTASWSCVGRRALSEHGNELGTLDDVTFDPATGTIEMLRIGDREIPAGSLLGSGSYAVVLDASQEPAPLGRRRHRLSPRDQGENDGGTRGGRA